jgi:TonB family protein
MVSGPGIVGPRAIYAPTADFTDAARRDRVTGIVVMSVVVDATGRVESVSVFESLRDDLDRSAVTAMRPGGSSRHRTTARPYRPGSTLK